MLVESMSTAVVRLHRWDEIALEKVTEMLSRKIVTGERGMLAQVYLKAGCVVPMHAHESEQMTYILQGALKFLVGGEEITVREGEVLQIASRIEHQAEALDDTFSLTPTPGHSPHHCCVDIRSGGQHAVVTGDMMHHALQCREPGWSTIFDTDKEQAAKSRRSFLGKVADTSTLVLPIHFPSPTVGRVAADGERFRYSFVR